MVEANIRIRNSGVPNYVGERILVKLKFNLHLLDHLSKQYHDRRILDFLMFSFPIDHDGSEVTHNEVNHKGEGPEFHDDIIAYLKKEIAEGAVIGPFSEPPFKDEIGVSRLNSIPKRDSMRRRVILDLFFPEGKSVNDGISSECYLGEHKKLVFPSIDDLVKIIHQKSPLVLLFKRDLLRAYRQLPVDFSSSIF